MQRHWSQVVGLPVYSSEEEQLLGRLRAVFVNPESGQILAFLVGWFRVATPHDIRQWGTDSITLRSEEDLVPPSDILRIEEFGLRRTLLNGKKVLTRSGKRLGRLRDFAFDPTTSSLTTLDVSKTFFWFEWAQRTFPAKDIQEITETAIILNVDEEAPEKAEKSAQKMMAPVAST